jgi:DNA-binding IclR family transcriptional regulator
MENVVVFRADPAKAAARTTEVGAGRYSVPVVVSTFRILDELAKADGLGLNEVTQRTGIAKSTVFRILATLIELGYVLRRESKYSVTNRLATLANDQATSETLRRVALPFMLLLRDEFGETVNLGVLRLDKVEYIEVAPSEYALRFSEKPGFSVQVHASALGKVLLAYATPEVVHSLIGGRKLPMLTPNTITDPNQFVLEAQKARHRGYAFDKGETSISATCVAAPILGGADTAIAALSISGPSSRFNPRKDSPVVEKLQLAVAEISRQLQQRHENAGKTPNHMIRKVSVKRGKK